MKLYIVKRIGDTDWDQYEGFVVAANSPAEARKLCADVIKGNYNNSDAKTWSDPEQTTCKVLKPGLEPRIVLDSYKAG